MCFGFSWLCGMWDFVWGGGVGVERGLDFLFELKYNYGVWWFGGYGSKVLFYFWVNDMGKWYLEIDYGGKGCGIDYLLWVFWVFFFCLG